MQFLQRLFSGPHYQRTLTILLILVITATVPLVVYVSQKQQDIRQRASELETQTTRQCMECFLGTYRTIGTGCNSGTRNCDAGDSSPCLGTSEAIGNSCTLGRTCLKCANPGVLAQDSNGNCSASTRNCDANDATPCVGTPDAIGNTCSTSPRTCLKCINPGVLAQDTISNCSSSTRNCDADDTTPCLAGRDAVGGSCSTSPRVCFRCNSYSLGRATGCSASTTNCENSGLSNGELCLASVEAVGSSCSAPPVATSTPIPPANTPTPTADTSTVSITASWLGVGTDRIEANGFRRVQGDGNGDYWFQIDLSHSVRVTNVTVNNRSRSISATYSTIPPYWLAGVSLSQNGPLVNNSGDTAQITTGNVSRIFIAVPYDPTHQYDILPGDHLTIDLQFDGPPPSSVTLTLPGGVATPTPTTPVVLTNTPVPPTNTPIPPVGPTNTPVPSFLAADVDRNNCIRIEDFSLWRRAAQGIDVPDSAGRFFKDGVQYFPNINGDSLNRINILDYTIWFDTIKHYPTCPYHL